MNGWIGITLGDITGIGPEVTLKALAAEKGDDGVRYVLLGDSGYLRRLQERLGLNLPLRRFEGVNSPGRFFYYDLLEPLPEDLVAGSPAAASAALAWLAHGTQCCLRHELDALVTGPVNKESILRLGHPFIGQTEFISQVAGTDNTAMMLLGQDDRGRWLRVALATTHVPLKLVAAQLLPSKIEMVIELAERACRDLGLGRRRVGVCGLNPHAGEGGELGNEEQEVIVPAIEAAARRGIDVSGPFAADTLFYRAYRGEFDVVVAMYHDQGLVPLKLVAFEQGVNWTLGLPFVRTSPDHGTAYDIAGKGSADPSSMAAAIALAKRLSQSN